MEIIRVVAAPFYYRFLIIEETGPEYYVGDEYRGDISDYNDEVECTYGVRQNVGAGFVPYYELSEKEKTIIRFNLIKEFHDGNIKRHK